MSDMVGNPEDRFSRVEAHMVQSAVLSKLVALNASLVPSIVLFMFCPLHKLFMQ